MRVDVDFVIVLDLMNDATLSGACKVAAMHMKLFTLIGCYAL
jgi:hypothetical protein